MTAPVASSRPPSSLVGYSAALLAAVAALTTANPLLSAASVLVLFLLARLLWRPGEPPVLLFAAGYQWMQVTTLVFMADFEHRPVSLMSRSNSLESAIWLGLIGVLCVAIGMRIGLRRLRSPATGLLDRQLAALNVDRLFAAYLICATVGAAVPYFTWRLLPIAQVLLALGNLKWVFYIILGYACLRRRIKVSYFIVATALEFVAGIGFFSGFKTVLFVCAMVLLGVNVRFSARTVAACALVLVAVVLSGLGWMSIKQQYRDFLNGGTGQQVVLVSPKEQVEEFANLITNVGSEDLSDAAGQMFRRLAYVSYFAAVLDYVPRHRPFEGGAILLQSLRHILLPRFLDPNKPVLESDSEITMRYTGLAVASSDRGTSIGIGYMAEGYVDFGVYGMLLLVLLFGVLWGRMYSWILARTGTVAAGLAFATTLLMSANQFEIAESKLLGGMMSEFLVFAIFILFAMPGIEAWLAGTMGHARVAPHHQPSGTISRAGDTSVAMH